MPQQNGGDGWGVFQRLASRYDDPQKLEADLAELEELRRRAGDPSRTQQAPGPSASRGAGDPIAPQTVAEVLQLQDRGLIDDEEVRRLLGLAGSTADLHEGWRDTIRQRAANMGWRGRGQTAAPPPGQTQAPPWQGPPPQGPPPGPPPPHAQAPPRRRPPRPAGARRFLPSLGVGGPPDFIVHRLGWGIIWRFGALGLAYILFPTQAQKVAIGVGLLLLAFLAVGGYLRWWRRSDLTGTAWRLALAAALAVAATAIGLPAVVVLTVLTFGCLLMLADVAWTVLWPWMGEEDEPQPAPY
jgi:hypothetical protein